MQHFTMGQYFNRMNIFVTSLLLLPIVAFIAAYTVITADYIVPSEVVPFNVVAIVAGALWLLNFILINKKIKSARNGQGLGSKLEKYFQLTIVRYLLFEFLSLFLVIVFYLSRNDLVTALFVLNLLISALVWPVPSKVTRDLKLRGDEREMVYYKKDVL